jgi:hypothetical protein
MKSVDVLVMFVQHQSIEAELLAVRELIDVLLIEPAGLLAIPELVRYRNPAGVVLLVEVRW